MEAFNNFTNLYPISKTLRFKLIPIGNTLKNFINSGILKEDEHRAESYVKVKKIIDEYHKFYIDQCLSSFEFKIKSDNKKNSLEEYYIYYIDSKQKDSQKSLSDIKTNLRKLIAKHFKELKPKDQNGKVLKDKDLITKTLPKFVENATNAKELKDLLDEFKSFTVYFKELQESRNNIYSGDEKATSIAFRIVHDNLPIFIDNIKVFEKISNSDIAENFNTILNELFDGRIVSMHEIFSLEYFNHVITQRGIDAYNTLIGGKTTSDGKKLKGLNEYINLYNQQHKQEKLPKFKILFKQILSDRSSASWLPEKFNDDCQVIDAINDFYKTLQSQVLNENGLKNLLLTLGAYNLNEIYIKNDLQLTTISQKATGEWNTITASIKKSIESVTKQKRNESYEDFQNRIDKIFKAHKCFSLAYINECLGLEHGVECYFSGIDATESDTGQKEDIFTRIFNAYNDIHEPTEYYSENVNTKLTQNKEHIQKIKHFLDSVKALHSFIKPLIINEESSKDERFYGELNEYWSELDLIINLYDKVRNYVTQKPYSTEKIKLNFQCPTLLDGWDFNKEIDNKSVILRQDGKYYLAIMSKDKNSRKVFSDYPSGTNGNCYEKMVYKLLPGPYRMLPKVFFSSSNTEFPPTEQLLSMYNEGTYKKSNENFCLRDCHALIDYFKEAISRHKEWEIFGFKFSETSSYSDINDFYNEIEQQNYKVTFNTIDSDYIDRLVEEGKIFLFQIYNKDFSEYSKGTPNMHTLYWNILFDRSNLDDMIYRLNGEAKIFFRKKSIDSKRPTHPAGIPIALKSSLGKGRENTFAYDLIKDKRYTVDQFQFHVPITMNFRANERNNINGLTNQYLQSANDTHVIGIDRGERNLLYLVVIDKEGKICEQMSLNKITTEYNGTSYTTDYHELLDAKEGDRLQARQNWQNIEKIKDLKDGYLSQVIHKISELMVKYNAIVVLEDLNSGFIRGRQKVEKQVYQKFEKMLIDKLNYLVFKKRPHNLPGGVLHAYQLTNKFESFSKLGKQSGFLFYIPAWNTSKIDPVTGFVNLFDIKYESVEKAKSFFGRFDTIKYDSHRDLFEWTFDYGNFTRKADGTRRVWSVCSYGDRIRTYRDANKGSYWVSEEINLTEKFKSLFERYGISLLSNLKDEIGQRTEKDFFTELISLFKLMLQMRNSKTGTDTDYLISPVCDKDGIFFDSRDSDGSLPENADANGAYNIARKGLMLINNIKKSDDKNVNLVISNKEWLSFVQK